MINGTRPYKSAHGHDMSCFYVINHKSFGDQTIKPALKELPSYRFTT